METIRGRRASRAGQPLTTREIEILQYLAQGNSNRDIARIPDISDQTVKNYITAILEKLEARDRTQAVVNALRRGWIKLSENSEA